MKLLIRRPEAQGYICVAPPSNLYDFSFLAPCPSSGLMINGDLDRVVPSNSVAELTAKLKTQRGIKIEHEIVPGANHFLEGKMEELTQHIGHYIEERMAAKENEGSEKKKAITAEVPDAEEAVEPDESEE